MCRLAKPNPKKGHKSVKIWQMISEFELDQYFIVLHPSELLNEIDASLQKLLIGDHPCAAAYTDDDDTDGHVIPMCLRLRHDPFVSDKLRR